MVQWINRSHPPTLMAAVFLGYFSGVMSVLRGSGLFLLAGLLCAGGAFGSANNKKLGYGALGLGSVIIAGMFVLTFLFNVTTDRAFLRQIIVMLELAASMVFPLALVAAVFHAHSRTYMQAWFD